MAPFVIRWLPASVQTALKTKQTYARSDVLPCHSGGFFVFADADEGRVSSDPVWRSHSARLADSFRHLLRSNHSIAEKVYLYVNHPGGVVLDDQRSQHRIDVLEPVARRMLDRRGAVTSWINSPAGSGAAMLTADRLMSRDVRG